jgi:hypothetical protein
MAQVPVYPSFIFFYAQLPAVEGGATPILRSDILHDRVREQYPEFADRLLAKGVRYTRVLPPVDDPTSPIGRSWPSTYHTNDFPTAQLKARELGVELQLLSNGDVRSISNPLSAIKPYAKPDPQNAGRMVFFNSMVAAYTGWKDSRNQPQSAVTYGDGEWIEKEWIEGVVRLMDELTVSVPWQQNDVMCIDNDLVMHSRQPFTPPRRILAYVAR